MKAPLRLAFPLLTLTLCWILALSVGAPSAHAADADTLFPAQRGQPTDDDGESAEDEGPIDDLADVYKAVVQIEAVGTFVDPEEGMLANAAGSGSGFIIDETGIAVTNNHVVTGGALFRVYVAGEEEPRNARVVGVAECADLAVIDIQGDGFPYLDWYEEPIQVGLDIYAAGFPLGDPEFTLTRGIIAKASAGGESSWASIDSVLQHDADIVPGNSGGPLVDGEGKVVGVNYRLNQAGQYFAISRDEALALIERLRGGENVDAIGINSEAITIDEDLTGIWVSSIDSGSVADQAGLEPGDILLAMEGLDLGVNGTIETYCDILRSHDPSEDVLSIEVLRLQTDEVLEGQLNGRELEQSFSIADETSDDTTTSSATPATYEEYMSVTDEQGIMSFEVPVDWVDVFEEPWVNEDDETLGLQLWAVPDIDAFYDDWGIPGVVFSYSESLAPDEVAVADVLDGLDYSDVCTYDGRESLPDGFYRGEYDLWSACSDSEATVMVMALRPETEEYLLRIEVYTAGEADFEAMDRILDTFLITPPGSEEAAGDDLEEASVAATVDDINTDDLIYDFNLVESPALSALLPAAWTDIETTDWADDDDLVRATLTAAFDVEAFNNEWSAPGMSAFSILDDSDNLDPTSVLEENDFSDACTYDDRIEHAHTIYGITYEGVYDIWTDCGGEANVFVVLATTADSGDHGVLIYYSAVDEADAEAFDVLTESFYVVTDATAPLIDGAGTDVDEVFPFNPDDYTTITDEAGAFSVSVPRAWDDVLNDEWLIDGDAVGRGLSVAPDVASFEGTWETPGIFVGVSESLAEAYTPESILDELDYSDECEYDGLYDYTNEAIDGYYDVWLDCGGTAETVFVTLAANPIDDASQLLFLYIYMIDAQDVDAFDQALATVAFGDQVRVEETAATATVVTPALNVRAGPGTNYARIAAVQQDDTLEVTGQFNNCAWLLIRTPAGEPGWVSGNGQYTTFAGDCATLPTAEPPAAAGQSSAGQTNSRQGCYTFINDLGAELTITFTRRNDSWNTTFQVPPAQSNRQCFDPGRYTFTFDAPPPWDSTNGELTVEAGVDLPYTIGAE